jgi:outer membrane autotransporter protein
LYSSARAAALLVGFFLSIVAFEAPAEAACTSGATATCDTAGNPYTSTLTYNNVNQTLTLQNGVIINTGSNLGIHLQGSGSQTLNTGTNVTITTTGGNDAILIIGPNFSTPLASSIIIDAAGAAVTTGGQDAWGYDVWGTGSIRATVGDVTANGNGGVPVYMTSSGGSVSVTTGNVKATGNNTSYTVYGVYATSTGSGASAGDVTVNTTGGTVSLTGTGAVGNAIRATSYAGVTVTTAGVEVAGSNALTTGIWATSFGTGSAAKVSVDTSAGSVSLTGASSLYGIFAGSSGGPVEVKTANVSTKGSGTTGIQAQTAGTGVNGAVTVTSTAGLVKTEGAGAVGINALNSAGSGGGLVTVNAGNVTTTGTGAAYGIKASSTSGAVKVTAGTISTAGNGASGVNASAGGAIDVAATKIVTTGNNAYGFQASGTGTADVKVTVGEVQTGGVSTGTGSHGVYASGGGLIDIESIVGSKITTKGTGANGVSIDRLNGATTINVKSIETTGDNSNGIHVYNGSLSGTGTGGAINITANSIVTKGATAIQGTAPNQYYAVGVGADGIDAFNIGAGAAGKITIDTSVGVDPNTLGLVSVSGRKARGIVAVSGTQMDGGPNAPDYSIGGGAIDIKTGTVTTTGDFGTAIYATNWGSGADGAITITALGAVSASGANVFYPSGDVENQGNYQPNGISAFSWNGGDITITTKDVSSVGAAAPAITAQSGNGDVNAGLGKVTINTTGGTVSSKGDGSDAVRVGGSSGVVSITTGDIKTEGWSAYGILAGNTGPNNAMTIDTRAGKITTTGDSANGIGANSGSIFYKKANAGLVKILAGDIDVQGKSSGGISASTYNGAMDVQLFGTLTTGVQGGDGIYLQLGGTTTASITITSTGKIKTTAANADGITTLGALTGSTTAIINGEVRAEASNANGLILNGTNDSVTVNANAKVYGGASGIVLQENSGNSKIINAGTITGAGGTAISMLGATTATFDNDGTVNGDVLMYNGNDTAILRSNSTVTGNIDGKGGTDKLQLRGTGTSSSLDVSKILNFESGEKLDAGTWALTGTNASFAATFDVKGGKLAANATLVNTSVTVENGATLGGTGTLGSILVSSGGTLAPGNSIGTINAATATYNAGAIYEVELNPTSADKLAVTGIATIDSTAEVHVVAAAGTYTDGTRYQILTAGTRNGAFSSTVVDNSAFLDFTIDHSIAGEVWLEVKNVASFPDVAETPNQIAAAEGIEEQGSTFPLFAAIIPLDEDDARRAFDLASGEIHATVQGVVLDDTRFIREAILARLDDAFGSSGQGGAGADLPAADFTPRATAWGQAFGSNASASGDGNAAGFNRSIGGFFGGVDTGEPGAWRAGLAGGYKRAGISVPDRASTATVETYEIAAYGGVEAGAVALRFGGALASGSFDTARDLTFPGFSEVLTARYAMRTAQAFGEVAYRSYIGGVGVEPFANVAYVTADTEAFTETGGSAALSGGPEHSAITVANVGARFSGAVPALHARMTALIAWQHRWGDMTPTAEVAFSGGTPFKVSGTPRQRDSVRIEAGLDWDIGRRSNFSLAYTGQIAAGGSDHGVKARFSIRF